MAGYSGTPLHKKLGFKPGFRAHVSNIPDHYRELINGAPGDVTFVESPSEASIDLVHAFVASRADLMQLLPVFRSIIKDDGMIWVSWPKKSSGVASDVDGNAIRQAAFPLDLVDVKVCAVDDTWSGLKLVIRKEHRQP